MTPCTSRDDNACRRCVWRSLRRRNLRSAAATSLKMVLKTLNLQKCRTWKGELQCNNPKSRKPLVTKYYADVRRSCKNLAAEKIERVTHPFSKESVIANLESHRLTGSRGASGPPRRVRNSHHRLRTRKCRYSYYCPSASCVRVRPMVVSHVRATAQRRRPLPAPH